MMGPLRRALRYRRVHGTRKMIRHAITMALVGPDTSPGQPPLRPLASRNGAIKARELAKARRLATSPLQLFNVADDDSARVSLVTDSVSAGSLYGGVGTSLLLAALLAESRGARLRIITRHDRADPSGVEALLKLYGIDLTKEVQFALAR